MLSLSNPEIRFNLGTINWVVGYPEQTVKTVIRQSSTRYQPRRIYFFRLPISVIWHVELAKHDGLRNQYPYEILTVVSLALYPCLASVSISIILLRKLSYLFNNPRIITLNVIKNFQRNLCYLGFSLNIYGGRGGGDVRRVVLELCITSSSSVNVSSSITGGVIWTNWFVSVKTQPRFRRPQPYTW
jgi:hypothetical protein